MVEDCPRKIHTQGNKFTGNVMARSPRNTASASDDSAKSQKTGKKVADRVTMADMEAVAKRAGLRLKEKTEDTVLYTTRGTPRIRRPKRSREELGDDPNLERNKLDMKLGGRVPRELSDQFKAYVNAHPDMTQSAILTLAIQEFLQKHDL
jgi:hypothetical protein